MRSEIKQKQGSISTSQLAQIDTVSDNLIAIFREKQSYKSVSINEKNFIDYSIKEIVSNIFEQSTTASEIDNRISALIEAFNKFHYFPLQTYSDLFEVALEKFLSTLDSNVSKVYILPGAGLGKLSVKSFQVVMYMFRGNSLSAILHKLQITRKIQFTFLKDGSIIRIKSDNIKVLFVDDFVGTGASFESELLDARGKIELQNNVKIPRYALLCLVIDKETKSQLNQKYDVFDGFSADEETQIEEQFKQLFPVSQNFNITMRDFSSFSNALLVSMVRTPNNTIPFFYRNQPFLRLRVYDE